MASYKENYFLNKKNQMEYENGLLIAYKRAAMRLRIKYSFLSPKSEQIVITADVAEDSLSLGATISGIILTLGELISSVCMIFLVSWFAITSHISSILIVIIPQKM